MTILFDLDGTLTDSGEGIIKSSAMVLEKYGLPVPSFEEMRVFVGPPLHETFHKFGIDPAVASGPLITTINDLVAVVSYYGLAWILLLNFAV